ncbi:MAG: hypothetical protein A2804_03490 [Candidatus Pacebacteria bacterium RIFCSPHIGHO2_01_FULL_46_10]|nr:MAG: hypothetical protein A2804_03490 [Candidatus Pacebacteria bacterium RIFCSPHIGHO2_01_FULL_46_10]
MALEQRLPRNEDEMFRFHPMWSVLEELRKRLGRGTVRIVSHSYGKGMSLTWKDRLIDSFVNRIEVIATPDRTTSTLDIHMKGKIPIKMSAGAFPVSGDDARTYATNLSEIIVRHLTGAGL